ncbi:hypothetical protein ACH5RR_034223 [Cinchona calisaya]|uniref:F-box domain-containing protein n=1 Tax=Cinchona calisaya TaxID=153742 RepID=A0ABD2YDB3_9GENT
MGKVASGFGQRKCAKRKQLPEGHISQLPHEILVHILSFLTFNEAVRTSVLSKRWTDLGTFSARLDFCDCALERIAECKGLRERERSKFVKWFAFASKVQRLELDLSGHDNLGCQCPKSYAFPYGPHGISGKSLESNPYALIDFKSLKALNLTWVNMSREVLEFILHNCQYLERLVVRGSNNLINVEVSGPLALKHLEICFCYNIECLTIRNADLVSLKVSCVDTLVLDNVPMLTNVLTLRISYDEAKQLKEMLHELPQLPKLKQLTLNILGEEDESLLGLISLIRGSSNLEKLVIKYFLENAAALEKIIINPRWDQGDLCCPEFDRGSEEETEEERDARRRAKQKLNRLIPSRVELVIL